MVELMGVNAAEAKGDALSRLSRSQIPSKAITMSRLEHRQNLSTWDTSTNLQLEPRDGTIVLRKRKVEAHDPGVLLGPDSGPPTSWRSMNETASGVADCRIPQFSLFSQQSVTVAPPSPDSYPGEDTGSTQSSCQRTSRVGDNGSVKEECSSEAQHPPLDPLTFEARPISSEQLALEVRNIYSGLVAVEAKCIIVGSELTTLTSDRKQIEAHERQKWQAMMALHRTLLYEHHDFLLASQHPSAHNHKPLRRSALRYSMPARMWKHAIHSVLEVLRRRLPDSMDHMLQFIYTAYQMMALLYEPVAPFQATWIEHLGDLAPRETWGVVARSWYSLAPDMDSQVGRLYHHLRILARPNLVQQLHFYCRSLIAVEPSFDAQWSLTRALDMSHSHNVYYSDPFGQDLRTSNRIKDWFLVARESVQRRFVYGYKQFHIKIMTSNALSDFVTSMQDVSLMIRRIAASLEAVTSISGTKALLFLSIIHALPGVTAASDQKEGASEALKPYYLAIFGGLCLCALLCLFAEALGKDAAKISRALGPLLIPITGLHCVALVVAANKADDLPLLLPIVISMSWLVLASVTLKMERKNFEPDQHALFTFWVLLITAGLLYASSSMMAANTIHSSVASCFTLAIYLVAQLLPRPRSLPV